MPVFGMAIGLALLMFFFYRRELRFHTGVARWVLPGLRSIAVFLIVLCLAGPVLRHEETYRQLGRVLIFADASASMSYVDAVAPNPDLARVTEKQHDEDNRFERVQQSLLQTPVNLIQSLTQEHDVELFALRGSKADRLWWRRNQGRDASGDLPARFAVTADASFTSLDQPLRDVLGSNAAGTAIILLTDGQHNAAGSPELLATELGKSSTPVFTVGYGQETPPVDISLLAVQVPEAVFPGDHAEGTVAIQDNLPAGLKATASISYQNKVLWQQPFETQGQGTRRMDFHFPAEALAGSGETAALNGQTQRMLDVQVKLDNDPTRQDRIYQNNQQSLAIHLLTRRRKVLILDGRPRWETRYLHNHFERDERWEVSFAFDDLGSVPSTTVQAVFPKSADEMNAFDLVILGDLRSEALTEPQHHMLRQFVEQRGGGLIMLDGQRGHLQAWRETSASSLIPVSWGKPISGITSFSYKLTDFGITLPALRLSDSASANLHLWQQLPQAFWCASAQPLADATVVGELQAKDQSAIPALVWRRMGAGSVLWMGTDEFWRWRYEVADMHHQRFWMQVASWIAAPPFHIEDDQLSLGTDRLRYREGDTAELRVRLRKEAGIHSTESSKGQLRAHLQRDGKPMATINLEPDPAHGGVFRAITGSLPSGAYTLTVSEGSAQPHSLALSFEVQSSTSQEWGNLVLNRPLLESMAQNSSGKFLRENDIAQLPALLKQLDRSETRVRETMLWSSWWWFGVVIALLTIEWLLRKRWRLV